MSTFDFRVIDRDETLSISPKGVVIAGYTGRNREAASQHIEELALLGVPRPASIPDINVFGPELLSIADEITVAGEHTSGEAEPVMIFTADDWYLAVGSDHTDRDLETVDMRQSKGACQKTVSTSVYSSSWATARFNHLQLQSFIGEDNTPYQSNTTDYFMDRELLLEHLRREVAEDLSGYVVFCGTVPLLTGEFMYSDRYRVRLSEPSSSAVLEATYGVKVTS